MTKVPQLLFSCSGDSAIPVFGLPVISRLSRSNSPPTTIVGRRMRIQRVSICSSIGETLALEHRHFLAGNSGRKCE